MSEWLDSAADDEARPEKRGSFDDIDAPRFPVWPARQRRRRAMAWAVLAAMAHVLALGFLLFICWLCGSPNLLVALFLATAGFPCAVAALLAHVSPPLMYLWPVFWWGQWALTINWAMRRQKPCARGRALLFFAWLGAFAGLQAVSIAIMAADGFFGFV